MLGVLLKVVPEFRFKLEGFRKCKTEAFALLGQVPRVVSESRLELPDFWKR